MMGRVSDCQAQGRHGVRPLQVLLLLFFAAPLLADEPAEPPAFELKDGDRVVFLGNTLIERMQRYGYVEAALTARWPDRNVTFRNLGWSGDTVWAESRGLFDPPAKGYQRMIKHVGELKPTVIFLGYGNVEAFDGEKRLPAFVKQYEKLLDDLEKVSAKGVRFVLIGPNDGPKRIGGHLGNEVLTRAEQSQLKNVRLYADAISAIAARRTFRFFDLATPVFENSEFRTPRASMGLDEREFPRVAYLLLSDTMPRKAGKTPTWLDSVEALGAILWWRRSVCLVVKDGRMEVNADDTFCGPSRGNARAEAGEGGFRVTIEAEPLLSGTSDVVVTGLADGTYAWMHNGEELSRTTIGEDDEQLLLDRVSQFEALRKAIVEKNRLYFLKWRPQNVTYLTLFRKHEQGNNAAELAEFDKLVAAKEVEIAKLRKPVKRTYELIRVEPQKKK